MDENQVNTPDTAGQAQQEPEQQTTGEKTTGYQVARGTLGVYRGAGTGWDGKSYVDDWKRSTDYRRPEHQTTEVGYMLLNNGREEFELSYTIGELTRLKKVWTAKICGRSY